MIMEQHLLKEGPLLNKDGNLDECGYALSLVKKYDRNLIKAGKSRIKEWVQWAFAQARAFSNSSWS